MSRLRITKIQQLMLNQENHDKEYHRDIYERLMPDKAKHYTLPNILQNIVI